MKKIFIVCLVLCSIHNIHGQTVKKHGHLHVDSTLLKDEKGNAVVLRGMSFGWHNWWPRFYNEDVVKWLHKDWHCSVVRAAMGIEPNGGYKQDSLGAKQKIKAVVEAAIKENIYVIIDWHSHNINLKEAKSFFIEMARLYGKHPHVIYELFNEPDEESWKDVKSYSEEIIKAIREIDPDNIILVGSPHWDQDIHLPAEDPIKGYKNLMYTLHFYAGTHRQWLRDRTDQAIKKGLPIFISESAGMEASGNGKIDDVEWKKWIDWAEKNKISWITWSVSDKDETCSVLQKSAKSEGQWKEEDMKESGIKARNMIREYNKK
jgi:endoglucanase